MVKRYPFRPMELAFHVDGGSYWGRLREGGERRVLILGRWHQSEGQKPLQRLASQDER